MQKKYIVLTAVLIYAMLMVAGGVAYFVLSRQPTENNSSSERPVSSYTDTKNEPAAKDIVEPVAEGVAATTWLDREALVAGMTETVRDGLVFYTHDYPEKPSTGIYLRPFVVKGIDCTLKNDVYYFYSIYDGSGTAWIHGDRLEVNADGQVFTMKFDPKARRDKVATGADYLHEHYVANATDETLPILRAIGNASKVSIYYYQDGLPSQGISRALSTEEIARIRDMVNLYDYFMVNATN